MKHNIVNKSLSEQIHESLRDQILKGDLRPGDRIVELEVARNFGVSQAPVREALLKLADEELVISKRNKGTFVSNFSISEVDELYDFRLTIEKFAIQRAFERLTVKDLEVLDESYNQMVLAGQNNDLEILRIADINFHTKIYEISDHKFMFTVWESLVAKLTRIWYLHSQMYYTNLSELTRIHEPILRAFHEHDLQGCLNAFKEHVNYERKQRATQQSDQEISEEI